MNTKRANKIIRKNSDSVLYEDPKELFQREKEFLNQPFFFEGTNGKGVLLIHGWTTTPYEIRRLGKYLNENGYTVSAPLLRGHGTVPRDLENVRWEDWLQDVEKAYYELKSSCNKIYVGGTSIGSCLAVMMDKDHPETAGLLLLAAPHKIRFEKIAFPLIKILKKIKNYNKKLYPPTFGGTNTVTRLISYQSYSMTSALEAVKLIKESRKYIPTITKPCFIIQSLSDHIITKKSAQEIYASIKSKVKKIKYIKRAYHTFISDIKNENVFEEILDFLEEN
ncbi:MAG: alpha/beta fold hydrolase [Patescibacteria group bacterium]